MIKGVIVDFDMCIFDTHSIGERALDAVIEPLRRRWPDVLCAQVLATLWTTALEDVVVLYQIPDAVAEQMRRAHQMLTVPETACTYGDERYLRAIPAYRVLVTSGYQLWQEAKIRKTRVARLFDRVIIDAVDNPNTRKGKMRIFQELMDEHAWLPGEVMVVGDNPHSELRAGKELGMITVQTLRPTVEKEDGHHYYVHSLIELPRFFLEPQH